MRNTVKLLVSIIGCQLIGIISASFTIQSIPTWYAELEKPFFSPPNWIFGPMWTLLYFFMGISSYLIWKLGWKKKKVRVALAVFLTQLTINFLWSPFFFGLRSPIIGLITIIVMLTLIAATIRKFYPLSKTATYLLIPYFLWVSFATLLNLAIVILN